MTMVAHWLLWLDIHQVTLVLDILDLDIVELNIGCHILLDPDIGDMNNYNMRVIVMVGDNNMIVYHLKYFVLRRCLCLIAVPHLG